MVSSSQRCKLLGRHLAISGENWWVATLPNLVKTAPLGNKVKFTASKAFSQVPLLPLSNTEIRDDNQDTALQMINFCGAFNIFVYDNHIKMGVRIKAGHVDIFIGLCALINTYPHETTLTKRILNVVYAIIQICGRNKYMLLCGLYEIRIHYADWENICKMRLYKRISA